jgi:hypothetical protein
VLRLLNRRRIIPLQVGRPKVMIDDLTAKDPDAHSTVEVLTSDTVFSPKFPDAQSAVELLRSDAVFSRSVRWITNPWGLGVILAIIVLSMIILGPSTESRFIYTDF